MDSGFSRWARRLFSTCGVRVASRPNFEFSIVIGTRENTENWLHERNQFSAESGINVRSFDWLSERLKKRFFLDYALLDTHWTNNNPETAVSLANPFAQALTDSEWKDVTRPRGVDSPHFIERAAQRVTECWRINQEALAQFSRMVRAAQQVAPADAGTAARLSTALEVGR